MISINHEGRPQEEVAGAASVWSEQRKSNIHNGRSRIKSITSRGYLKHINRSRGYFPYFGSTQAQGISALHNLGTSESPQVIAASAAVVHTSILITLIIVPFALRQAKTQHHRPSDRRNVETLAPGSASKHNCVSAKEGRALKTREDLLNMSSSHYR